MNDKFTVYQDGHATYNGDSCPSEIIIDTKSHRHLKKLAGEVLDWWAAESNRRSTPEMVHNAMLLWVRYFEAEEPRSESWTQEPTIDEKISAMIETWARARRQYDDLLSLDATMAVEQRETLAQSVPWGKP